MSTAISPSQTSNLFPKTVAMLKANDEKPRLQRSTSIDTIKRINTYICSPQSYLLPAILTTWLKTGQNGLQSSTEKTIFMFRSLLFSSFLLRYLLKGIKSGSRGGQVTKVDLQKELVLIILTCFDKFLKSLQSNFVISALFQLTVVVLTVQLGLCAYFLSQCVVPLGLGFLVVCLTYIVILGYGLNKFYYGKRDVKRKIL